MVRDNVFERTRPMAFKSGSLEITGNYFDPGCGDYSVGGYSRMLDFGEPTHNGNHIAEAVLHNIYIGDNVNATDPWRRLLWVDDYDYEGETKFVAYNLFVDGRLFKYNSALSSAHLAIPSQIRAPVLSSDTCMSPYPAQRNASIPLRPTPGTTCTRWPSTLRERMTSPKSASSSSVL